MSGNASMFRPMEPPTPVRTNPPIVAGEPDAPPSAPVPEEAEVRVVGRGGTWGVRVSGRSGRSLARSAPLLLLAFRRVGAEGGVLEAMVAGRSLADLSDEVLESALVRAVEGPTTSRKRPFFEDGDGARRP